ncbi:hypothetical protein BLA29_002679 [Euroglyphus maynei]|uniref:Uncharacterized protein n=1 Tax=Euroglyphus maynei TaxID=6958 RepID=A0A1Y3ANL6_EURMA|nr:hypothetical protein BLA29_002679 [Euroglyphus maynei]
MKIKSISYHICYPETMIFFPTIFGQFHKWKNDQRKKLNKRQRQQQHLYSIQILRNSLILWIICSFIIRLIFATDILVLLVSEKEQMIDTFKQLDKWLGHHNDYRVFVEKRSTTGKNFRLKFAHFVDRFVTIDYEDATTWYTIDKLINDRYFLIVDRERANLIANFYENLKLHVSNEGWLTTMSNIAIRKNLNEPCRKHLIEISKKIFHYGFWKLIMSKLIRYNWLKTELQRLKCQNFRITNHTNLHSRELLQLRFKRNEIDFESNNNDNRNRILNATNTSSLIHFYLLAIAISMIIFFLEYLHYIIWKRKSRKTFLQTNIIS